MQQNDKIVELDGKKIKNKYDLSKAMTKVTEPNDKNEKYNGEEISLKVERNDISKFKMLKEKKNAEM